MDHANTHVYATDSTVWKPPSTMSLISRAVKPATPYMDCQNPSPQPKTQML